MPTGLHSAALAGGGIDPGSETPLRIATLSRLTPPVYAGGGLQSVRLAAAIVRRGIRVRLLTARPRSPAAPAREVRDGVEVLRLKGSTHHLDRSLDFGLRAGWWLLRHDDWDLLHTHGFSYWTVPSVYAARLRRRPIVVTTTMLGADDPTAPKHRLARWLILPAYRACDAHVALSAEIEALLRRDPGCRGRIRRIPNGVDVEHFRPPTELERARARERMDFAPEDFVVISCGALIRRKNVTGLVRSAARLEHRPVKIVLAGPPGDAEETRELEQAIAALPEGVEVIRTGYLEAEDVPGLMWAGDCFALNSRAEGLALSLCEALASGLPSVATDIPGSRDVLSKGGGRLVPLDDEQALADAWDELARAPDQRTRLGREARKIAEDHYSWDQLADRYVELYRELLAA